MQKSEALNEIADALSQLQGEIKDVTKDKKGYGYTYAELGQVLEVIRPLLSKYGLAVIQLPGKANDNSIVLETILMHKSGQFVSSMMEMGIERLVSKKGNKMSLAQSIGSVLTYARRYSLASLFGIAQVDNDASLHDEHENDTEHHRTRGIVPVNDRDVSVINSPAPMHVTAVGKLISAENKDKLNKLMESLSADEELKKKWLNHWKVDSFDKLTESTAERFIAFLTEKIMEHEKKKLIEERKVIEDVA